MPESGLPHPGNAADAPAHDGSNPAGGTAEPGEGLCLAQANEVEAALARVAQDDGPQAISDLLFPNLWLFRRPHDYRLQPGPLPCISGHTYDGTRHLIPLFDLRSVPRPRLLGLLQQHRASCFYPVSARTVADLDPTAWDSQSSRDDADYLYPASHFLHYRGAALNKKRNLAKQLRAAHRLSHRVYGPAEQGPALQVLRGWMVDKHKADGDADELACEEALQRAQAFGLKGFMHFAEGEPAGFVLAQRLQPGVLVMRFAKGLDRFKGIYQHMFQHFCQHAEAELGEVVVWLNFEQDMGLANFRRTKLSYQPTALVPKYRLSPRPAMA